mgnify:CR=1 FL=1
MEKIQYYKNGYSISSSLVYPIDKGYYYDYKLDNQWVKGSWVDVYQGIYSAGHWAVYL